MGHTMTTSPQAAPDLPAFRRSRLTWLCYAMMGWYAYLQAGVNPAMPFLRADLELSYTLASLHASAFALGMIVAGLTGDRIGAALGTRRVFWGGSAGMIAGMLLFVTGQTPLLTIPGALIMGMLGSLSMIMVQITLINTHERYSPIALTEGNIVASLTASLIPVAIGAFEHNGAGWRWALLAALAVWGALFLTQRALAFPAVRWLKRQENGGRLPGLFWLYLGVLFLAVAAEWGVWLWAADYFISRLQMEAAAAAPLVSFFTVGAVTGRIISSRLLRAYRPPLLIPPTLTLVFAGFPLFWLGSAAPVNVLGLFLLGWGAASLFPLGLAAATSAAGDQSNRASARVTIASGSAILLCPAFLGVLADAFGIQQAYLIVPVLALLAMALALAGLWLSSRLTPAAP
jgi:predicted MFS family arabinose efflux permease